MNEIYHKRASEYADVIENNIYNALYDRPSLLSLVESQKFSSCLDMGCGPGAYIESLKVFCKSITAIDLSTEFIQIVSNKFPEVKSYVCNIGAGLKKEQDGSFDLVISPLTIHYIEDLNSLFSEVNRVLKNNGVFAFSTHHPSLDFENSISKNYFQREKLTQMWDTLGDETEVSFYRRPLTETINSLLKAGFVIDGFSEGKPSEKIKEISEDHYQRLTTRPQFVFIKAIKKLSI
jgi:SAM-dependent methyltransferase